MNPPEPIRAVVAAVDFGESSGRVLALARLATRAFGARLHVLHVVHDLQAFIGFFMSRVSLPSLQEEFVREARAKLGALCEICLPASEPREERVLCGIPASVLAAYLKEQSGALLVAGRHGQTKPEHSILGSTVNRLLQSAPCPILLVP